MEVVKDTIVRVVVALGLILPLGTFSGIRPASAATWCWCTNYVANRFGLTQNFVDAGDWNNSHSRYGGRSYLESNGYSQVNPQPGAIVVMERTFPGADSTYGHVGVAESIDANGRLTLRGANQTSGSLLTIEAGCNNVRSTLFATSVVGRTDVTFWMKRSGSGQSGGSSNLPTRRVVTVNFTAIAATTGVNVRSGPSLSARVVGRLQPNQRVRFDAWTYGDRVTDMWIGTPDERWYRLAGTQFWVSSAVVYGNAPGSRPLP